MTTIITGTAGSDKLSAPVGGGGLSGGKGVDYYYGSASKDAFSIRLSDFDPTLNENSGLVAKAQDFIYNFGGAGIYDPTNNDFLHLQGFGAGSTLTFHSYGYNSSAPNGDIHAQFYTIHSTNTGLDYIIAIGSTNGNKLILGDYNFYN